MVDGDCDGRIVLSYEYETTIILLWTLWILLLIVVFIMKYTKAY